MLNLTPNAFSTAMIMLMLDSEIPRRDVGRGHALADDQRVVVEDVAKNRASSARRFHCSPFQPLKLVGSRRPPSAQASAGHSDPAVPSPFRIASVEARRRVPRWAAQLRSPWRTAPPVDNGVFWLLRLMRAQGNRTRSARFGGRNGGYRSFNSCRSESQGKGGSMELAIAAGEYRAICPELTRRQHAGATTRALFGRSAQK